MAQTKSVFDTLSSIDVSSKVEKKANLTYLPWAWAWGVVKKHYPNTRYEVIRDPQTDKCYNVDPDLGIMVHTKVTIKDESLEMWLPVMNHRNKALKLGEADMFDINKTLMRCLTKNLAMFGLGHYIYAGEDLPEVAPEPVSLKTLKVGDPNWENILKYIGANKTKSLEDITKMVEIKYKVTMPIKKALSKAIEAK
jgi:hypothetical protein